MPVLIYFSNGITFVIAHLVVHFPLHCFSRSKIDSEILSCWLSQLNEGGKGCVRRVNNASTMSEVEFFINGFNLFINRLSLFSHLFFVVIEMKIEDTNK